MLSYILETFPESLKYVCALIFCEWTFLMCMFTCTFGWELAFAGCREASGIIQVARMRVSGPMCEIQEIFKKRVFKKFSEIQFLIFGTENLISNPPWHAECAYKLT